MGRNRSCFFWLSVSSVKGIISVLPVVAMFLSFEEGGKGPRSPTIHDSRLWLAMKLSVSQRSYLRFTNAEPNPSHLNPSWQFLSFCKYEIFLPKMTTVYLDCWENAEKQEINIMFLISNVKYLSSNKTWKKFPCLLFFF